METNTSCRLISLCISAILLGRNWAVGIQARARQFEQAAAGITLLAGKTQMRAMGIPLSGKQDQNIYGSLCLCFGDSSHFNAVRSTVQGINLRGDNLVAWTVKNTFKAMIPIWCLSSRTENAVILDRIIYRSFDNMIESSAGIRIEQMYGFSLKDVKR